MNPKKERRIKMKDQTTFEKEAVIENAITSAVQIPGVKVNRRKFLSEIFANENVLIEEVLELGPIEAGVEKEKLAKMASTLILKRTGQSSIASFAAGIPGGLAMAATIPADVLQFFGMALRLAQELSYLYGADDLWQNGQLDDEKVKNQLLLYFGVMFGVSGAVSGVRVLSNQIAKTTLKKLPQKALTKTFWYPIIQKIGKAIGVKITKATVAQGVSKAVPVIGGIFSGGINFASMLPMAKKLQKALESAIFDYTEADLENDIYIIENIDINETTDNEEIENIKEKIFESGKKLGANLSNLLNKKNISSSTTTSTDDIFEMLKKLSELKDSGIITEEEFQTKKADLLSKI